MAMCFPDWQDKHYAFFCNSECECFPCHETSDPENFNCLFCYCPLYALGEHCGGNFSYTDKGIKNCSKCGIPHKRDNYGYIIDKFHQVADIARRDSEK